MFVPAKTPRAVRRRLYEETSKAMQQPEVRDRLVKLGGEIVLMNPDEFDGYWKAQAEVAGTIVKAANIRAN
jgi:tripartite-type tricarboxylate transporter receptor subunit TctC